MRVHTADYGHLRSNEPSEVEDTLMEDASTLRRATREAETLLREVERERMTKELKARLGAWLAAYGRCAKKK